MELKTDKTNRAHTTEPDDSIAKVSAYWDLQLRLCSRTDFNQVKSLDQVPRDVPGQRLRTFVCSSKDIQLLIRSTVHVQEWTDQRHRNASNLHLRLSQTALADKFQDEIIRTAPMTAFRMQHIGGACNNQLSQTLIEVCREFKWDITRVYIRIANLDFNDVGVRIQ